MGEEEELEDEPSLICPVCKHGRLQQSSETQFSQVMCQSKDCPLILNDVMGGLEPLEGQLEATVDNHSRNCFQPLHFAPGPDGCLLACCDACQLFHAIGGK